MSWKEGRREEQGSSSKQTGSTEIRPSGQEIELSDLLPPAGPHLLDLL